MPAHDRRREVFSVLGGLQGEQKLCVVEQEETALIGGFQTAPLLERARARGGATNVPAAEHAVQGLVKALDASGELDGRTIGVYLKFPDVFTVGGPDQQMQFDSEPFQRCTDVGEESSGETVLSPEEAEQQGEKTPFVALAASCTHLLIFQEVATAAGDTLNNSTFKEGLESLDEVQLLGVKGSFGPGKYDAPVEYFAYKYNPDYPGPGQGVQAAVLRSDESFQIEWL